MESDMEKEELLRIFPRKVRGIIEKIFPIVPVTEIRLRSGLPLCIGTETGSFFVKMDGTLGSRAENSFIISPEDLTIVFERISQYSVFAFKEDIGNGFITLKGGHRVGLCGQYFYDGERAGQLKNISSLNIRIAREVRDCALPVLPWLFSGQRFCHTLLISPPGVGKTTCLRDLIRLLSDGTKYFPGKNISVVDERSEIGNRTREGMGFYLGSRTDLMDHCTKAEGMLMMLRTMTPEILAADEIGDKKDIEALSYIRNCGCKLLMTAHGNSLKEFFCRPVISDYLKENPFERYIILEKKGRNRIMTVYNEKNESIFSAGEDGHVF
ncbi:MAG: stage III sporulation protein AA [Lachnospiraceae bacterium]|nr:stage III sporulation protein AA [Lachnospiraceae bacterium]